MERTNEPLLAAFATTLRSARIAAGLSQEDLAARADISARHISFLETCRRQPSLATLMAISDGLGLTMREFAGRVEDDFRRSQR